MYLPCYLILERTSAMALLPSRTEDLFITTMPVQLSSSRNKLFNDDSSMYLLISEQGPVRNSRLPFWFTDRITRNYSASLIFSSQRHSGSKVLQSQPQMTNPSIYSFIFYQIFLKLCMMSLCSSSYFFSPTNQMWLLSTLPFLIFRVWAIDSLAHYSILSQTLSYSYWQNFWKQIAFFQLNSLRRKNHSIKSLFLSQVSSYFFQMLSLSRQIRWKQSPSIISTNYSKRSLSQPNTYRSLDSLLLGTMTKIAPMYLTWYYREGHWVQVPQVRFFYLFINLHLNFLIKSKISSLLFEAFSPEIMMQVSNRMISVLCLAHTSFMKSIWFCWRKHLYYGFIEYFLQSS